MKKAIIVTGSVATGKTKLSKALAKKHDYEYLNITSFIKQNKLSDGYDKKRKCEIIDIKKLNHFLIKQINNTKKTLIIDGHLSHYLPPRYVKKCYITTCEIKTLNTRLKKRKYPNSKIQENLQVEIFQLPLMEAQKKYKNKKHNKIKKKYKNKKHNKIKKKYKNKKNKTTPIKLIDTTKGVKV